MKQVMNKIMASLSILMVFCMHVYFVMLLGLKPAMAADTEKKDSVIKVGVFSEETKTDDKAAATAAQTDDDKDKDEGINIKINGEDGITISGSESLVKKLQNLEKKIEDKIDEKEVVSGATYGIGKFIQNFLFPMMIVLMSFGFVGYMVYSKQKIRKEYLETIRTLAQNNQPIPPELLNNLNATNSEMFGKSSWNSSYGDPNSIQGIKYLFIGLGIAGFMILLDDYGVPAALGFMFLVIGGFHIVKSQLLQKQMDAKKAETTAAASATVTPTSTTQP
jgi:hypothetical protein